MALKTDYKDYEFRQGETLRKYNKIDNEDGTISLEDVTEYSVVGDSFSAVDFNKTNEEVNKINEQSDDKINELAYSGLLVDGETYNGIASDKGIKLRKVVGNTVQEATNGYQLFDQSKLSTTSLGGATATNNGDGSFTISGSGNLSSSFAISFLDQDIVKKLKVGNIYLNCETSAPYFYVEFLNSEKTSVGSMRADGTKVFNITDDILGQIVYLRLGIYGNSGATIKTGIIKPMLYQDGDGTWEQFTGGQPAPSPDYPMDIQNVEINNIYSRGQNLFDRSNASENKMIAWATGLEFNEQGSISSDFIPCVIDKVYSTNYKCCVFAYGENKEYIGTLNSYGTFNKSAGKTDFLSFEIKDKRVRFFRAVYRTSSNSNIDLNEVDIILNFGGTVLDYVPYQGATVETSLKLAKDDTFVDGVITRKRAKITFDGSSDEPWGLLTALTNTIQFGICVGGIMPSSQCICDKFIYIGNTSDVQHIYIGTTGHLYIHIDKSVLTDSTLAAFKSWLQSNPIEVEYELAEPTTEELQVPTISSYYPNTNLWTDNEVPPTEIKWELLANSDNTLEIEKKQNKILIGTDPVPSNDLGVDGDIYIYIEE